MSTLSFNVTIPDGFDQYNRQVHLFIRGGLRVTRLHDSVVGPSDNFADLTKWLMQNTSRVPSAIIDNTALAKAALFLETNGFTCNCYIQKSTNLSDLVAKWAPYFLLCENNNNGKRGLRSLLPSTAAGAIDTGTIEPSYLFTEETIVPDTLEISYTGYNDRQPFVAQIVWRQQTESGVGIIRTAEVRYTGTATSGPYETHDLSEFCTSETHAVKVGAYILAKRVYTTHTIRFSARPEAHVQILDPGEIIRVELQREATNYAPSVHNYLYQVERVTETLAGDVTYEATHFPVDNANRSLVALDVVAAEVTGILLPDNRTGVTCDINSSSDTTIPPEVFTPTSTTVTPGVNSPTGLGLRREGAAFGGSQSNETSTSGQPPTISGGTGPAGNAIMGNTLTADGMPTCPGLTLTWMATVTTTGETSILDQIEGTNNYVVTESDFPPSWVLPDVPVGNIGIFATGVCSNGEEASSGTIILDTRWRNFSGCTKAAIGSYISLFYTSPGGSLQQIRTNIQEIVYARAVPYGNEIKNYWHLIFTDGSTEIVNGAESNVISNGYLATVIGTCIG